MHMIKEKLDVPVVSEYDVVVCGGGPAGIAAAISAARQGMKTLLLEAGGCLGGVWTSGYLTLILDVEGKGGIMHDIKSRLSELGAVLPRGNPHNFVYDVESMKLLLEELCSDAGVDILLHTRVANALKAGSSIQAVAVESSQGRMAISGKVFIDCTGNGDLAAQAGCSFDTGHPDTGQIQPASMLALVSGVPEAFRSMETYERKREFGEFFSKLSFVPSNKAPTIIGLPLGGLYLLSVNHEFDVRCDDITKITQATLRGRAEINAAVKLLREQAGWSELSLVSTPTQISLREGRRIRGEYVVSLQDIITGQMFEDGVCTVKFAVDIHATDAKQTHGYGNQGIITKPYQIPYRSLIATEIDNLGLAGRCISGDFFAHASYRVTANAVAMGEAIGFAAALAIASNVLLRSVSGVAIAAEMSRRGYIL
jgi:hypothetical protein